MPRPSLRINLKISSKEDERFLTPEHLSTVSEICPEGFQRAGIIYVFRNKNPILTTGGILYNLDWGEQKPTNKAGKNCMTCSRELNLDERKKRILRLRGRLSDGILIALTMLSKSCACPTAQLETRRRKET